MGSRATSRVCEDGHHLVGKPADFGGLSFLQIGDRQVEGGQRGVEGVALIEKPLPDLSQKLAGLLVIPQAGRDAALHPVQADLVLRASVRCGQDSQIGEDGSRLRMAVGLGKAVHQVMSQAEQEAGIPVGIDEAVGFLQSLDGGFRVAPLGE